MNAMDILNMPTAEGRDGIHISAQLQVDAMQLEQRGMGWVAQTMYKAAEHIIALEDLLARKDEGTADV